VRHCLRQTSVLRAIYLWRALDVLPTLSPRHLLTTTEAVIFEQTALLQATSSSPLMSAPNQNETPAPRSEAPALGGRVPSQVFVTGQLPLMPTPHAGQPALAQANPQVLQAALQQALNAAAQVPEAPQIQQGILQANAHFEVAAGSGAVSPNARGESPAAFDKCCKRKTSNHDPESRQGLTKCSAQGCNKAIHVSCYKQEVLKRHSLRPVVFPASGTEAKPVGEAVCCSKTCHLKLAKELEKCIKDQQEVGERFLWDRDGKSGDDDPNTSLKILLDWITTGENYSNYRGSKKGLKKFSTPRSLRRR